MDARAPQHLRTLLESIAARHDALDKDMMMEPYYPDGASTTSKYFLAKLKHKDNQEDIKFFAKVANLSEEMRKGLSADKIFSTEDYVYNHLMPMYMRLQEENKVPEEHRLPFAKFYGSNNERMKEIIVLEDLTARGYDSLPRTQVMSWEYVSTAIAQLAKWHALSMVLERKEPEEFKKITERLPYHMEEPDEMTATRKAQMATAMEVLEERFRPKMQEFKLGRAMYDSVYLNKRRTVLAYGGFRQSNIMHKMNNGTMDMIPVDYQLVHASSVPADIYHFLFLGTDHDFRRMHYGRMIDHYYKMLGDVLKSYDMEVSQEYPRKDFDADMKESTMYAMILGVTIMPGVMADKDDMPQLSEEGATMSALEVKPSKLYAERMNGIMETLAEWVTA